jgi:SAM-dependent methyltransferase
MSRECLENILGVRQGWFYDFEFSNGGRTRGPDELTRIIHQSRAGLIFPYLDNLYGDQWTEIECLDVACHQGWFAVQVALRGAKKVHGIDIREQHVEMGNLIKTLGNISNLTLEKGNLFEIGGDGRPRYDLTFFLGVLYHLSNPLEALKHVRSVTRRLCVVESQVARPCGELQSLWGSDERLRSGPGIVILESDEQHAASEESVVLVPTLNGLYRLLYAAGFDRLYLAVPSPATYRQFADFDRIVVFAHAD